MGNVGADFWLYWTAVILIVVWITALTHHFITHKRNTNKRITKLEFTVGDIIKLLNFKE